MAISNEELETLLKQLKNQDIDKYYKNDNFEKLLGNLDKLGGEFKSEATNLTNMYKKIFHGENEEISFLLEHNEHLKEIFDDLVQRMGSMNEKIETSSKNIARISDEFFGGGVESEIDEEINKIKKKRDLNAEILRLTDEALDAERSGNTQKSERLLSAGIELEKKRDAIKLSEIGKKLEEDNIDILDEEIKNRDELSDVISDNVKGQVAFNKKQKEANKLIEDTNTSLKTLKSIYKGIKEFIMPGVNKWIEIDHAVNSIGRSVGVATSQIKGYQENILSNYDTMAAKLGMTFKDLFQFQEQYNNSIGRATILRNEELETMASISKFVGAETVNESNTNMDLLGASPSTSSDYLMITMARASANGLNAKKTSAAFAKNIKLASKYNFKEGVNGISKMTMMSERLKFNMESIGNAANKFQTIEGAISTSANLQMLGGSYAMQFGNPLEVMNLALTDMEGLTNKIVKSFSSKATFNRNSGMVEMSPIDRQLLKHASESLGISYDEAWNMASQQAKISDIDRNLNKGVNFSETDKNFIYSQAKYNTETKKHEFTYFDENGDQKTVSVNEINKDMLKAIKDQQIPEEKLMGDVQGIRSLLEEKLGKRVSDTNSYQELVKGLKEAKDIFLANVVDPFMTGIKSLLAGIATFASAGAIVAGAVAAWKIGGGLLSSFGGKWLRGFMMGNGGSIGGLLKGGFGKIGGILKNGFGAVGGGLAKLGGIFGRGISSLAKFSFGALGKGASTIGRGVSSAFGWAAGGIGAAFRGIKTLGGKALNGVKTFGKKIMPNFGARGASASAGASRGFGGKMLKWFSKIPKWGKIFGAIGIATAVGATSANASNTTNMPKISGATINKNDLSQTNTLNELVKQTDLLSKIYAKQSGQYINENGMPVQINDAKQPSLMSEVGGLATSMAVTTKGGRNLIRRGSASIAKRLGIKTVEAAPEKALFRKGSQAAIKRMGMKGASKMLLKSGGVLGAGGLIVDGVNFLGQSTGLWEEGSHTDKVMNIGSAALTGAGIGATIGSVIPILGNAVGAAVGAAIGGVIGTVQEYGTEIKEFFVGSETMTEQDKAQQKYEESKLGQVDINHPAIFETAAYATCKMHDLMISIWHYMNGKQSNGIEEDKGLLGDAKNVVEKGGKFAMGLITAPAKLISGALSTASDFLFGKDDEKDEKRIFESVTIEDGDLMRKAALATCKIHDILNDKKYNILPFNYANKLISAISPSVNNITAKNTVGETTYIKPLDDNINNNSSNSTFNNNINLNVSGTLRLVTDKSTADVDLNKLLENPQFKEKLLDIVKDGLNSRAYQGLGVNKNTTNSILGGGYYPSYLYGKN